MNYLNRPAQNSGEFFKKVMLSLGLAASMILMGCDKSTTQPTGPADFPPAQDVPVSTRLRDHLKNERIEGIVLIKKNTDLQFVGRDGKNVRSCGRINAKGDLVVTDKKQCGFKGTLTNIKPISIFVVEGTFTKYCVAGNKVYPC